MNENSQPNLDFKNILSNLHRKFEIILCKWSNESDFEVRIRTEIERDNDDFNELCDQWVEEFSNVTRTVWVKKISNTGPKIRFRKQYQCWTHGSGKIKKELLFDARRCRAVLDMKVLTDTPLTRRKNKHIRMGLNAVVKINFTHLHRVNPDEAFSFFVHNCPRQPEPIETEVLSMQMNSMPPSISTGCSSHMANMVVTPVQTLQLTEPLLMCTPTFVFDPTHDVHVQNLHTQQIVTVTNSQHNGHIHQPHIQHHTHDYHLQ